MKIRRIQLYHFRGFEDLQIQFPKDAKSIVFIGENGSGKSSLLEGMSMILRDTLYKHHKYDGVNWNNPLNVHNSFEFGSISIGLATPKRSYEFSKSLSADRTRFVTEDKLVLEKGRDLTEEEKMEYYAAQGDLAFEKEIYDKALEYYLKLLEIKAFDENDMTLVAIYLKMAKSYYSLGRYEESLKYILKSITIQEQLGMIEFLFESYDLLGGVYYSLGDYHKAIKCCEEAIAFENHTLSTKDNLVNVYHIGLCYDGLRDYPKAIDCYEKALKISEKITDNKDEELLEIYSSLGVAYHFGLLKIKKAIDFYLKALELAQKLDNKEDLKALMESLMLAYKEIGDKEKADYYAEKINQESAEREIAQKTPELYRTIDKNDFRHLNEYLEVVAPLVLHYTVGTNNIDNNNINKYKDALSMAFRISTTTDFAMITDWFVEHENEENRKRLRADNNFRSTELELIRKVIDKGLALLNNTEIGTFSQLQTELVDAVKDGQVSSWLSIKKSGNTMNVSQLSDGEKRVLVLLIDLTRRLITAGKLNKTTEYLNGAGIVLIDEIELHLHPKWQCNLIPTLNNLFPNIQFVVTTHSPLVVSNLFHLNGGDNLLTAQKEAAVYRLTLKEAIPIHTTGRDVANVLGEHFGVERRSALYQEKIDGLFADFENDTISIEDLKLKLNELKALLGNNDPDVKSAEIIVNGLAEV